MKATTVVYSHIQQLHKKISKKINKFENKRLNVARPKFVTSSNKFTRNLLLLSLMNTLQLLFVY